MTLSGLGLVLAECLEHHARTLFDNCEFLKGYYCRRFLPSSVDGMCSPSLHAAQRSYETLMPSTDRLLLCILLKKTRSPIVDELAAWFYSIAEPLQLNEFVAIYVSDDPLVILANVALSWQRDSRLPYRIYAPQPIGHCRCIDY
mmetsp:Transcript_1814/g.2498  ORF Transcript_1814/g.2498 Transcript_1814/m.2498 type:complete len:144 (+) Transcript_1814:316-747(+)